MHSVVHTSQVSSRAIPHVRLSPLWGSCIMQQIPVAVTIIESQNVPSNVASHPLGYPCFLPCRESCTYSGYIRPAGCVVRQLSFDLTFKCLKCPSVLRLGCCFRFVAFIDGWSYPIFLALEISSPVSSTPVLKLSSQPKYVPNVYFLEP